MHRFLVFSLWALLLLVALVVVLGVFATRGTVDMADLPRIQVDQATKERADEKIADFSALTDRTKATGQSEPVQISLTHEETTALIADWGEQDRWYGSVAELQIAFGPGTMTLTGVIHSLGLEFPFRIDLDVVIENRERKVELQRGQLGELYAPGFLRNIMLGLAMRTVDAGLPRVSVDIESLVLTDGEVIVSGETVP
jgi:hypothetical protein